MNMELDIIKESCIEYCENEYALSTNYLKDNYSVELIYLLNELNELKEDIRECNDKELINGYKMVLEHLVNKIEGIINE